jgi:hypothetical protein
MDTTGAVHAVQAITTGLWWRKVRSPVCVTRTPGKQGWELGALLAAEVAG